MRHKYVGMTAKERLYAGGKMDALDRAVKEKNAEKVKAILLEVEVDETSVEAILEKYGLVS